jgi:hypothetical protein
MVLKYLCFGKPVSVARLEDAVKVERVLQLKKAGTQKRTK